MPFGPRLERNKILRRYPCAGGARESVRTFCAAMSVFRSLVSSSESSSRRVSWDFPVGSAVCNFSWRRGFRSPANLSDDIAIFKDQSKSTSSFTLQCARSSPIVAGYENGQNADDTKSTSREPSQQGTKIQPANPPNLGSGSRQRPFPHLTSSLRSWRR